MATEKYPQQNVNMPMDEDALARARASLDPGTGTLPMPSGGPAPTDNGGNGSLQQVRAGEWIDTRRIVIGGPASPSKDSPPEIVARGAPLASYDPAKAYAIKLGKPVMYAGRMLNPAREYTMQGDVCENANVKPAIIDAVELGSTPIDPDSQPS